MNWRRRATRSCSGCSSCAARPRKRRQRLGQLPAPAESNAPLLTPRRSERPRHKVTKMTAAFEEPRSRQELSPPEPASRKQKRVVIIGGGFAGIAAARALRRCDAEVVLIDRRNHHIFQPLLYQVATAVLAPAEIAAPIRQLAAKQKNLTVLWGEIKDLNLKSRFVEVECNSVRLKSV